MEIIIREASNNDYNQIHKLVKEVHKLHAIARPEDYKNCENPLEENIYLSMLNDIKIKIFVAELAKSEIVGYTVLKKLEIKQHPIMVDKKILHMDDLCVSNKYRRKGVGKRLYNKAKEYCKDIYFDKLELNVWKFNEDAIRFYEALGMKEKFKRYEISV